MASLKLGESSIVDLTGQVAVMTGGSTGIGHATVNLLSRKGAEVHVLDIQTPEPYANPKLVHFHQCDVSKWHDLSKTFLSIPQVDMALINAGVFEAPSFLDDLQPSEGIDGVGSGYLEPAFPVLDVNLKASVNCLKLAMHKMKHQERQGGRIVLTASATAYMPERSLPLYSAMKLALIGLVRSLKHTLPKQNITINAVAPSATATPMLNGAFLQTLQSANLPCSSPESVATALVFSATATQNGPVERYGGALSANDSADQRWNGRVIFVMGDTYTEVEEPLAKSRPIWLGEENTQLVVTQQAATMKIDGLD